MDKYFEALEKGKQQTIFQIMSQVSFDETAEVLEKGKRAQIGEIRDWKGKKYQKTVNGWLPVRQEGTAQKQQQESTEESKDFETKCKSIRKFLNENYRGIEKININKDFSVDAEGNLKIKNPNAESLTDGTFNFGKVNGGFYCVGLESLTSLKGAPREVSKSFSCAACDSLKTLEGAPREVGENFYCGYCESLVSLKGAPEKVGGNFNCEECPSLESLEGLPEKVGGKIEVPSSVPKEKDSVLNSALDFVKKDLVRNWTGGIIHNILSDFSDSGFSADEIIEQEGFSADAQDFVKYFGQLYDKYGTKWIKDKTKYDKHGTKDFKWKFSAKPVEGMTEEEQAFVEALNSSFSTLDGKY